VALRADVHSCNCCGSGSFSDCPDDYMPPVGESYSTIVTLSWPFTRKACGKLENLAPPYDWPDVGTCSGGVRCLGDGTPLVNNECAGLWGGVRTCGTSSPGLGDVYWTTPLSARPLADCTWNVSENTCIGGCTYNSACKCQPGCYTSDPLGSFEDQSPRSLANQVFEEPELSGTMSFKIVPSSQCASVQGRCPYIQNPGNFGTAGACCPSYGSQESAPIDTGFYSPNQTLAQYCGQYATNPLGSPATGITFYCSDDLWDDNVTEFGYEGVNVQSNPYQLTEDSGEVLCSVSFNVLELLSFDLEDNGIGACWDEEYYASSIPLFYAQHRVKIFYKASPGSDYLVFNPIRYYYQSSAALTKCTTGSGDCSNGELPAFTASSFSIPTDFSKWESA